MGPALAIRASWHLPWAADLAFARGIALLAVLGVPLLASAASSTCCSGGWCACPTSLQTASWMSYRLDCLESQVAELAEEVRLLRSEVSTLRRQLAEREERSVPASPAASAFGFLGWILLCNQCWSNFCGSLWRRATCA